MTPKPSSRGLEGLVAPSPQLLNAVLDVLRIKSETRRAEVAHFLDAHARSFSLMRATSTAFRTDHEELQHIRKLRKMLRPLMDQLNTIQPKYLALIIHPDAAAPFTKEDWTGLLDRLERLEARLQPCANMKLVTHQRDEVLEDAVACLMLRLEEVTGKIAFARKADNTKGKAAELASPEAMAIWMLLHHADPDLLQASIANRIVAIRKRHKDTLHERFAHYVFLGGRILHRGQEDEPSAD